MEFKIQRRAIHSNIEYNKHDHALAVKFSHMLRKELGEFVKAIIFFGSASKKSHFKPGDIDIMIIIDDSVIIMSNEVIQAYRIIVQNISSKVSHKLHVNTLRLSNYWEYVKAGDPILVNVLRDGIAIYDSGIFSPMQVLLKMGRIRPSVESILSYHSKSMVTISNSRWHINQAVIDLYWSVVDAAHAALMSLDVVPPAPSHVHELINKFLVARKLATDKHAKFYHKMYTLYKRIMHKDISYINGAEYDKLLKESKDFVDVMKKVVDSEIKKQNKVR